MDGRTLGWTRLALPLAATLLVGLSLVQFLYGYSAAPWVSTHAEGIDDAYISFRYAENLLAGHGLVFNPGERVEGYSNFLWVMLAAALRLFVGSDQLYPAIWIAGLPILIAVPWIFRREAVEREGPRVAALAVLLVALCPPLWRWSMSGLEPIAVLAVQLALWRLVSRSERAERLALGPLVLLLGLATLLRADGFVLTLILAFHWLVTRRPSWSLRALLAGAGPLAAVLAARWLYYGWLLPNTYYAKVEIPLGGRLANGLERLWELSWEAALGPFLLVLAWVGVRAAVTGRRLPFEVTLAAGLTAYWVWVGGDVLDERWLLAVYPLGILALLGAQSGGTVATGPPMRPSLAAALVLFFFAAHWAHSPVYGYSAVRRDGLLEIGQELGERYPEASIAIDAAGKIPFVTGLRTIDMHGLCDEHIAHGSAVSAHGHAVPGHAKTDVDYVLAQAPDLIIGHLDARLGLDLGLDAETYRAAGYRLGWLGDLWPTDRGRPALLAVPEAARPADVLEHMRRGYILGILVRAAAPAPPAAGSDGA